MRADGVKLFQLSRAAASVSRAAARSGGSSSRSTASRALHDPFAFATSTVATPADASSPSRSSSPPRRSLFDADRCFAACAARRAAGCAARRAGSPCCRSSRSRAPPRQPPRSSGSSRRSSSCGGRARSQRAARAARPATPATQHDPGPRRSRARRRVAPRRLAYARGVVVSAGKCRRRRQCSRVSNQARSGVISRR